MLLNDLESIIEVLDKFIEITNSDIADIQEAKHEILFKRNEERKELLKKFSHYKSAIDNELLKRSQNRDMNNLLNLTESEKLDLFKEKLAEFSKLHRKYSKMVFSVNNFYTNMYNRVMGSETQIGYETKPNNNPYLQLRG